MKENKKIYFRLLVILVLPLLLSGCLNDLFDDGETYYNTDDPQVEFYPLTQQLTLGATEESSYTINAQLIGEQRNAALELSVIVVDSLTTAQQGVQYSLPSTSITIPADSSTAAFTIEVSGEGLDAGDVAQLVLELQGTEEVQAAENLNQHTLIIQGGG